MPTFIGSNDGNVPWFMQKIEKHSIKITDLIETSVEISTLKRLQNQQRLSGFKIKINKNNNIKVGTVVVIQRTLKNKMRDHSHDSFITPSLKGVTVLCRSKSDSSYAIHVSVFMPIGIQFL